MENQYKAKLKIENPMKDLMQHLSLSKISVVEIKALC